MSSEPSPLNTLTSSDHLKVQAALAQLDPEILLSQLSQPTKPDWQSVLEGWHPIKVPRTLFNRWNAQLAELDHLHFEYDPSTEVMIIKCMLSDIHESVPASFIMQAAVAIDRLSRTARKAVTVGSTQGAFVILTSIRSLADILQSSLDSSIAT